MPLKILEGLKVVYQEGIECDRISQDSSTSNVDNNDDAKALTASYAISLFLAKHYKPFNNGKFVKKCLVETIKCFGDKLTVDEMSISLKQSVCGHTSKGKVFLILRS